MIFKRCFFSLWPCSNENSQRFGCENSPEKTKKTHTHYCFSHRIIHVLSLSSVICLLGYESCICSLLDNLHEPCRFLSYWMLSNHKTFHQRELFSGDNFLKIDSDAIPNSASARAHKADCHKPSVRHPGDHGGSGELVKRQAMFFLKDRRDQIVGNTWPEFIR